MAKTIGVFSTKGGVGKTLIAANLAVSLAKTRSWKVALLDLDLRAVGDMAMMLKVTPKNALVDLLSLQPEIDKNASIKKHVTYHSSSGIDFLPAIIRTVLVRNSPP